MNTPRTSIIAVLGRKTHALGKDGKLLWHIPDDWKRLKEITVGHPIIMGRKTFESIGRPLPERTNIVVTRDKNYKAEGVVICHSLDDALEKARAIDDEEIFIFGGAELYKQGLPLTDRLYLTLVDSDAEGDIFFPDYSEFTKVLYDEHHEHEGLSYTWIDLERE